MHIAESDMAQQVTILIRIVAPSEARMHCTKCSQDFHRKACISHRKRSGGRCMMRELQNYIEETLRYLEEHKKARIFVETLLVLASCKAAFELGTNIGEFSFLLIH